MLEKGRNDSALGIDVCKVVRESVAGVRTGDGNEVVPSRSGSTSAVNGNAKAPTVIASVEPTASITSLRTQTSSHRETSAKNYRIGTIHLS